MFDFTRSVLLSSALLAAVAGSAMAQDRSTADRVNNAAADLGDAWITTKVQASYFADADVRARNIDVDTVNGVVTLTGVVHSERERDQAVAIARTIDGVREVRDELRIDPLGAEGTAGTAGTIDADRDVDADLGVDTDRDTNADRRDADVDRDADMPDVSDTTDRAMERTEQAGRTAGERIDDAWITTKVKAQYFMDEAVKGRAIDVDTNQNVVTLRGTVDSAASKARAVAIAQSTEGVERVVDQLTVRPEAAGTTGAVDESDRPATDHGAADEANRPGTDRDADTRMPGSDELAHVTQSDAALLATVKSKLALDNQVSAFAIDVDVENGIVSLQGDVRSEAARDRALQIAREVEGVREVRDRLTIRP